MSVRFTRREHRPLNRRAKKLGVPLAAMVRASAIRALTRKQREGLEPKRSPAKARLVALIDAITADPIIATITGVTVALTTPDTTDDDDEGETE